MMGRIVILAILLCGLIAGAGIYYLQIYAYYDEIAPEVAEVQFTAAQTGEPTPVMFENYKGINSNSSPIRYRACYEVDVSSLDGFALYDSPNDVAEPLVAPGWFDCFDAETIGLALAAGTATAYLGEANFRYGFDRVIAVFPDGRAFSWQQLNACGRATFAGNVAPDGCPPAPESF